jgi:hypothetical protein
MTFITVTEPLGIRKHLVTFNTNCNSKVKRFIFYIKVYCKKLGFELTTLVLIGTDYIGSCKSNYHTITTTAVPYSNLKNITTTKYKGYMDLPKLKIGSPSLDQSTNII